MKKILLILIILLLAVNAYSQGGRESEPDSIEEQDLISEAADSDYDEFDEEAEEDKTFRIGDRNWEIGLVNFNIGVANNLLKISEVFNKDRKVYIDLERLNEGFNMGLFVNVRPVFFNVNFDGEWGFGFDFARITAYGNVEIAGSLLNMNKSDGEDFGAGGAAFVEIGIPGFFHINDIGGKDLRINVKLSPYVTAFYTKPEMKYSLREVNGENGRSLMMVIDYGVKVYTPFSLDPEADMLSSLDIGKAVGFDLSLGAEYPLFDFLDLGVNFSNIPIVPSRLSNYMQIKDRIVMDTTKIDLFGGSDEDKEDFITIPEDTETVYGNDKDNPLFYRPFKLVFYANYRPFKFNFPLLTVIPRLGLMVSEIYVRPVSLEAGVFFRCDLSNMFITTLGINYEDQMWKNSLDLVLNLRAFELAIGAAMQSQDFVMSWQGSGLLINFGIKFGW